MELSEQSEWAQAFLGSELRLEDAKPLVNWWSEWRGEKLSS